MLRSVTLGLALSIPAVACALATPPTSTRQVQVHVINMTANPVELSVTTPQVVIPDAVEPSSLPPRSTTDVTLQVPVDREWWIAVDGEKFVNGASSQWDVSKGGCPVIGIELSADGRMSRGCADTL